MGSDVMLGMEWVRSSLELKHVRQSVAARGRAVIRHRQVTVDEWEEWSTESIKEDLEILGQ